MTGSKLMFFILLITYASSVCGQINVPPSNERLIPPLPEDQRARQQQIDNRKLADKDEFGMISGRPNGLLPVWPRSKPDGKPYSKKELEEIKSKTEPAKTEIEKFRAFLSSPKSGIFKLFPNFGCESKLLLRADDKCSNFIPGSWVYSLRVRSHFEFAQDEWDVFDLSLSGDVISVDGFLSQSIIVPIGDVPIEDFDLNGKGLKFLTEFEPKNKYAEARAQYREIGALIRADGLVYAKRVRAAERMTYVARFIAFRTPDLLGFRFEDGVGRSNAKYLRLNNYDKRLDIIVVMRVVAVASDGSLTILWRELSRKAAPKLVYEKSDKIGDLK